MVDSVNTNGGALTGLQSLFRSTQSLSRTSTELSTGSKVSSAADDAATFSIAQQLRSQIAGSNAVNNSLDRAISTTDVAIGAGGIVSNLLLQLKEKAVAAKDPGLDDDSRKALNDEFVSLRDTITSVIDSAEFNGVNALKAGGGDVQAITNQDASGAITIDNQDLSLGGTNVTLAADQEISTAADADTALAAIEDSIGNVSDSLSQLGSGSSRLESLKTFNNIQSDGLEVGVGNLTDANLASSSANLVANQVKQALGITALNIANQAPTAILSLFRNQS